MDFIETMIEGRDESSLLLKIHKFNQGLRELMISLSFILSSVYIGKNSVVSILSPEYKVPLSHLPGYKTIVSKL